MARVISFGRDREAGVCLAERRLSAVQDGNTFAVRECGTLRKWPSGLIFALDCHCATTGERSVDMAG